MYTHYIQVVNPEEVEQNTKVTYTSSDYVNLQNFKSIEEKLTKGVAHKR